MKVNLIAALLVGSLSVVGGACQAQQNVSTVVDKVISSYGGDKLAQVKTLKLAGHYKGFNYGQSASPDDVDMEDNKFSISIDLVNQRKSFRWVMANSSEFSTQHQLFDGKQGYRINHTPKTVIENNGLTYLNVDRNHLNGFDIALVLLLQQNRKNVSYAGEISYLGKPHDKLKFTPEGQREYTVFVDQQSGYIAKMTQPHWLPGKYFVYHYGDWRKTQGVSYAADSYLTSEGKPSDVTLSQIVEVNPDVAADFNVPAGYKPEAAGLDMSKMAVKQLADNVYFAGSNWGFSLFYHNDDYFVAAGGYRGLTKRFEAVKAYAKVDKPLKYQVVSHHHNDHLAGMQEAAELGATFVTVQAHVNSIRDAAKVDLADDRFIIVDGSKGIADGEVKVVDYPNGHSTHNLLTYVPSA